MSKAISRRDFIKVTGAVGAAGLLAACGGNSGAASSTAPASSAAAASVEAVGGLSSDPVTLTMSWWGGESRHGLPRPDPVGRGQAGCLQRGKRSAVRACLHDRPYLLLEHDHL